MLELDTHYTFLPTNLVEELRRKRDLTGSDPQYSLRARKMFDKAEDANRVHSWWIEHPDVAQAMLGQGKTRLARIARKGVSRVKAATALAIGQPDIRENISHGLIRTIGEMIDPRNDGYRADRKTLNMRGFTPPNPIRVLDRLEEMFDGMKDPRLSAVEAAIYAHLMLAGTQPFDHGNKRSARVLQTGILHNHGYPSAPIPLAERELYLGLLEQALAGTPMGGQGKYLTDQMKPLFTYVAGKINRVYDKVLDDLGTYGSCA